ncbi:MAG: biopolymer transporter ExbD [Gammaproteobacteria bacterium]
MRYRWQRNRRREVAHLDVTAFLSLMVILVPFLLITAVFSRITILELSGPARDTGATGDANASFKGELSRLEIIVRKHFIEVHDSEQGRIARLENNATGYRLTALAEVLKQVKEGAPDRAQANILFEPQTSYDVVVQVMDTARVRVENKGGIVRTVELFPEIGLGDAP